MKNKCVLFSTMMILIFTLSSCFVHEPYHHEGQRHDNGRHHKEGEHHNEGRHDNGEHHGEGQH